MVLNGQFTKFLAFALACAPAIPIALGLIGFGRSKANFIATVFFSGLLTGCVGVVTYFVDAGLKQAFDGWLQAIAIAFAAAAIPEEFVKYLVVRSVVSEHEDTDIGLDLILGSAWVALGFALVENIFYVVPSDKWASIGFVRAILPVPSHVISGIVMGCCLAIARQSSTSQKFWRMGALLIPILIHGAYDSMLFLNGANQTDGRREMFMGAFSVILILSGVLAAVWSISQITQFGIRRLSGPGRPSGDLEISRFERYSRYISVSLFIAAAIALVALAIFGWLKTKQAAVLFLFAGSAALMLGLGVFFLRGPTAFRRRFEYLFGTGLK